LKIGKAVITAAAPSQHNLPLQTLIDRDGVEKRSAARPAMAILCSGPANSAGHWSWRPVFRIIRQAAARAGIELAVSPYWLRHAHAARGQDVILWAGLSHAK